VPPKSPVILVGLIIPLQEVGASFYSAFYSHLRNRRASSILAMVSRDYASHLKLTDRYLKKRRKIKCAISIVSRIFLVSRDCPARFKSEKLRSGKTRRLVTPRCVSRAVYGSMHDG